MLNNLLKICEINYHLKLLNISKESNYKLLLILSKINLLLVLN